MTKDNTKNRITSNGTNKTKKLITHDGSFHTDDIFACAALILYLEKVNNDFSAQGGPASGWEIIRTRDEEIIKNGDYIFDVGGFYNEEKNRFDHHQVGGAGKRPVLSGVEGNSDIEYSSFGLVWKKFGAKICGGEKAANLLDKRLVAPIDAFDNGCDLVANKYKDVSPFFIQHVFFAMEPTWREDSDINEAFTKSVTLAREILSREIIQVADALLAEDSVLAVYENAADKRILVLDRNYPFQYVLNNLPEPLFVVYPRKDGSWGAKAVRSDPKTFNNRKNFPAAWGGLRDAELGKVAGVPDAVFCHRGLFMAVAKSKEGAIAFAHKALVESS